MSFLYPQKKLTYFLGSITDLGDLSNKVHKELAEFCIQNTSPMNIVLIGKDISKAFQDFFKKEKHPFNIFCFNSSEDFIENKDSVSSLGEILYFKGSSAMNLKKIIDFFKQT